MLSFDAYNRHWGDFMRHKSQVATLCVIFLLHIRCGEDEQSPPRGERTPRGTPRGSPRLVGDLRRGPDADP